MGEEAFESLIKYDILKLKTNTVVSDAELFNALQVVPAAVLAFLKKELIPMKEGENKVIELPVEGGAKMDITKLGADVYTGNIFKDGKYLSQFKFRPLPSVGLVLLTTFELYDVSNFSSKSASKEDKDNIAKKVEMAVNENTGNIKANEIKDEISPIKNFLKNKVEKREYTIVNLTKSAVNCPDCDQQIFGESLISPCVCFGADRQKKIFFKSEKDGVKIRFSKGWDAQNMQMFLEAIKKRKEK